MHSQRSEEMMKYLDFIGLDLLSRVHQTVNILCIHCDRGAVTEVAQKEEIVGLYHPVIEGGTKVPMCAFHLLQVVVDSVLLQDGGELKIFPFEMEEED